MLNAEIVVIVGFAIVLAFCWLGKQQGKPSDPIS